MNSRLYVGTIMHQRLTPVNHQFQYPAYYYAFDLDELPALAQKHTFFGYNCLRPIAIHNSDYLFAGQSSIKEKLLSYLNTKPYYKEISSIMLITTAKFFNYAFNPVSFYYCCNSDGQILAVVAEVNNTFSERHVYILDQPTSGSNLNELEFFTDKAFHVSPFNDMTGKYHFRFSRLDKDLKIYIDLIKENQVTFCAAFCGQAKEFSPIAVLKTVISHPFSVILTMPRIIWQAALLYYQNKLPVYHKPKPSSNKTLSLTKGSLLERVSRAILLNRLKFAKFGKLEVELPDGMKQYFGDNTAKEEVNLKIRDNSFFPAVLFGADVGFGEAYSDHLWESSDLTKLIQFFIDNEKLIAVENIPLSFVGQFLNFLLHRKQANTLSGSRRNIAKHYDLSNEMFAEILDPTMTYSSAFFEHEQQSLEDAQYAKIMRIVNKASINAGDKVLEIGCGWGSLAIEAVRQTNCSVHGITLSENQYQYAIEKLNTTGFKSQISFELCDYRKLEGQYDKIISIEMLEAVGKENLATFFKNCDRLLKPNGTAVIQCILIDDRKYKIYSKRSDWIQKHIFPGGFLPSLSSLLNVIAAESSFFVESVETLGQHYAKTLTEWRIKLFARKKALENLGFDEHFFRTWNYYFSYCEAGFLSGTINLVQLVLSRPNYRRNCTTSNCT